MNYRKAEAKAAAQARFRGIWAAITTPFTADLALDEAGLRRNMRHLTDVLGVDGVFCTGVMGEFWALTRDERKRVVEIVVEEARGECGVGSRGPIAMDCEERADRGRAAELRTGIFAGVTGALALTTAAFLVFRPWTETVAVDVSAERAALLVRGKLP